jgi:hypothetical protein
MIPGRRHECTIIYYILHHLLLHTLRLQRGQCASTTWLILSWSHYFLCSKANFSMVLQWIHYKLPMHILQEKYEIRRFLYTNHNRPRKLMTTGCSHNGQYLCRSTIYIMTVKETEHSFLYRLCVIILLLCYMLLLGKISPIVIRCKISTKILLALGLKTIWDRRTV